ncbi:MAG: hypothetical protein JW727_01250 [Candidatus Aenigmarchaeota archaeon]|nr:hypothetical protein [Candidatus Aenigmarchaeota archaeon]
MKNIFFAGFMMLLVVATSGCTSFGGSNNEPITYGSGLSIIDFGSGYDYVSSGDTIDIVLKVQNLGDTTIENVVAKPYRLSWVGYSSEQRCNQPQLYPPNEELNRIGDPCTITWKNVRVPEIGETETYTAGVRIYYDYATITTAKVYALTEDAYKGMRERGVMPDTAKTISNSRAPIVVDVLMDNVFIVGGSNDKIPVTLKFTNIDNGYPQGDTSDPREFTIDSVKVESLGQNLVGSVDTSECRNARLRGGKTGDCIVKISPPHLSSGQDVELTLKITTSYTYVLEKEEPILVHQSLDSKR